MFLRGECHDINCEDNTYRLRLLTQTRNMLSKKYV